MSKYTSRLITAISMIVAAFLMLKEGYVDSFFTLLVGANIIMLMG